MNKSYLSFRQVVDEYPFTAASLRLLLLFRKNNGLDYAVLKRKRTLFFNRERFEDWLEQSYAERNDKQRNNGGSHE